MGQFAIGYEYKSGLRGTAVSVGASATWDFTPDILDMFQLANKFLTKSSQKYENESSFKEGCLKIQYHTAINAN